MSKDLLIIAEVTKIMYKRIVALICSILTLYSASGNLFTAGVHSCKMEKQEESIHCSLPMEKMDCCPVEQQEATCNCPEMNTESSAPEETAPFVIFTPVNHPGDFIVSHFVLLGPDLTVQQQFMFSENINSNFAHNKIYKTNHSFLI